VVAVVADALRTHGIRAILTGGGCATIYSKGEYATEDLDLILQSEPTQKMLDEAMQSIEFSRKVDHYDHPKTSFFVEFPRGPLSIGSDVDIHPVEIRISGRPVLALSPTDSCRDRLAAFYHWSDRQSLSAAVGIALRNRVNSRKIREWSKGEGATERYSEFLRELRAARSKQRKRRPSRRRASRA
jgi:hypothetical protein